jgi:hypothetical protein
MSNTIQLSGIFSEGYGIVPKKLMKAQDIKGNTKLVLCYLLSYSGSGSECFPSIDLMSDSLNMSKRTIVRCIKEATNEGYLRKTQGELSDKRANKYYLDFMSNFGDKKAPNKNKVTEITKQGDKMIPNKVTGGNSNNNININKNNNIPFDIFWELYDNKKDKHKCQLKWKRLSNKDKDDCLKALPNYIKSTMPNNKPNPNNLTYRKNPLTYLNGRCWEDEVTVVDTPLEAFLKENRVPNIDKAIAYINKNMSSYSLEELKSYIGIIKHEASK